MREWCQWGCGGFVRFFFYFSTQAKEIEKFKPSSAFTARPLVICGLRVISLEINSTSSVSVSFSWYPFPYFTSLSYQHPKTVLKLAFATTSASCSKVFWWCTNAPRNPHFPSQTLRAADRAAIKVFFFTFPAAICYLLSSLKIGQYARPGRTRHRHIAILERATNYTKRSKGNVKRERPKPHPSQGPLQSPSAFCSYAFRRPCAHYKNT